MITTAFGLGNGIACGLDVDNGEGSGNGQKATVERLNRCWQGMGASAPVYMVRGSITGAVLVLRGPPPFWQATRTFEFDERSIPQQEEPLWVRDRTFWTSPSSRAPITAGRRCGGFPILPACCRGVVFVH